MPHLVLSVLGPFAATLDARPLERFDSNKVRALLVYLALEAGRPHARTTLAGLLWPDRPEPDALANLRYALANLRAVLGDRAPAQVPHLLITHATLQLNPAGDTWVDATEFMALSQAPPGAPPGAAPAVDWLEAAVALYHGDLLEGFAIGDAAPFEEWLLVKREQLGRRLCAVLQQLADLHEQQGDYATAEHFARQLVAREPYAEEGHRQLMRLLAFGGRRGEALAQYERCRTLLEWELGVPPAQATTALRAAIAEDRLAARSAVVPSPPARIAPHPQPLFVGRSPELAWLQASLDAACAGRGCVLLIAGSPGSGKSALAAAFVRHALQHRDVLAAWGSANAYTGIGDPYLPFRQIVQTLTGDLESQHPGQWLSPNLAQRLRDRAPAAIQDLVEAAPDLADRFVPGPALLERGLATAGARPGWLVQLEQLLARRESRDPTAVQQADLHEQTVNFLMALARRQPLVLVVDDLQWADAGTVSLFLHLGRRLDAGRILLLGVYRPEEIDALVDGRPHPLRLALGELQRAHGDIVLDLDRSPGRGFVDALLDAEPNRLGDHFRDTLVQHTGGHALFTIELVRGLQERGDLGRDARGCWMETSTLGWTTLPVRVDAAIADRLHRLPPAWQDLLHTASVEGELFTAEVLAQVQGMPLAEVVHLLGGELSKRYPLVVPQGVQWTGNGHRSRYRFRHFLFQKALYQSLDPVARAHLHHAVGEALEACTGEQTDAAAAVLAHHFEAAGEILKAAAYRLAAGNQAERLLAHDTALAHFRHGLALLAELPSTVKRARLELDLHLALAGPLLAQYSYVDRQFAENYASARALAGRMGDSVELFHALAGLKSYYDLHLELQTAHDLAEECVRLATRLGDPKLQALAHFKLGGLQMYQGKLAPALAHVCPLQNLDDPEWQQEMRRRYGYDQQAAALSIGAIILWTVGYPDQAMAVSDRALVLARELDHPFTLAHTLHHAARFYRFRREVAATQPLAEEAVALARAHSTTMWLAGGLAYCAWVAALQGDPDGALAILAEQADRLAATGMELGYVEILGILAEACVLAGRTGEALATLEIAVDRIAATGFLHEAPEIYRLQGDVRLRQGAPAAQVEEAYVQAIATAQHMQAKSWELRATVSLAQFWQQQGKGEAAYPRLRAIYDWFTEGFDTPDLQAARRLLAELAV